MALKFKLKSKDEAPAELQQLYIKRDGAWVLDVDGAADKARLDEFRANNIALTNEVKDLKQRFEGIDPDEVRKLPGEKPRLEEDRQVKAGEIDKVVENRIKGLRTDGERQVNTLTSERDAVNSRLTAIQIDQGIITAATKRGLRASAAPDLQARARSVFRLVEGVPTAFEADGQTVKKGKDGSSPMTLDEWASALATACPVRDGTTDGKVYTTYLFGRGVFAKGNASLSDPVEGGVGTRGVELSRTALASDSVLINRRRYILHPRGVKFNSAAVAGDSPTNAELETAANWTRVWEAKNVRLVAVTHNN